MALSDEERNGMIRKKTERTGNKLKRPFLLLYLCIVFG